MGKKSKQNVPKNTDYVIKYIFVVESLSHVGLFCDSMDVAPRFLGFPRQEYWRSLPADTQEGCLDVLEI